MNGGRLGFGCSALVRGRTRRDAIRLLEIALDAGITHFDVARSYGTGDAEAYLGEFASRRREHITLATKFGMDPVAARAGTRGAKRVVRVAARRSRRVRGLVQRHASRTVKRGLFSPEKARASLAISLRQLRTDHVDAFLLHDCTRADWEQEDLQATLDSLRRDGSIGRYGPATAFAEITAIVGGSHPKLEVAQFEASALRTNALPQLAGAQGALAITHGCFRDGIGPMLEWASAQPDVARRWSGRLGVDVTSPAELAGLLLAAALRLNPDGMVLFSTGDPRRIEHNARVARERPYERAQVAEFMRLIGGLVPSERMPLVSGAG